MSFYSIIIIQAAAVAFGLATIVMLVFQRASFFQKLLLITSICSFLGLIAYLFELLSCNLEEALLAARFGYIGKSYAMVFFLMFVTKYCDVYLPKWLFTGLFTFSTVILALVLTCPWHSLYYTSTVFIKDSEIPHLVLGKGVVYYIFMVVTLLVMLGFIMVAFTTLIKRRGKEKRRLILLCLSGIVPAVGLSLNLSPLLKGFDPTPISIFISFVLVFFNVLRYGLLDTMQIASDNVMDYAGQGLVVVGKTGNFVYANPTAEKIFPELKGGQQEKALLASLFDGVDKNNTEQKIIRRDNIIYEINYSVLKERGEPDDKNANGYMAWIFDKTREYNHTRELERLREEAENANQAKTIFLAKMSHEIRTPMNGIMGFAELALEKSVNPETKEYLSYIKDSADALLGIVNDILDISKIEAGKMEILDVEYNPHKLFDNIATIIETQAEAKGLTFELKVPNEMPTLLYGDSNRLREILINILGNALKYTNSGSILMKVEIKEYHDDDIVFEIHVRDTGIGIKPDKIAVIFDSFVQADDIVNYHVEGTGLGLSISKQLAELMGGNITVESEYGKGSDFCIVIPQACVNKESDNSDAFEAEDNYRLIADGVKVLIVDDNDVNLKVENGLLERYGMKISAAGSGCECLKMIEAEKYDVILMDHMMPDMDGIEVMTKIRDGDNRNTLTPVILVTANAILGVRQKMLQKGFSGFISKPIDEKELRRELLRVLPPEKTGTANNHTISERGRNLKEILLECGIDMDVGMKYCVEKDFYKEVLYIFADSSDDKIRRLKQYMTDRDYDNYTILVHAVKGGAANIGAVKLSEMARSLEMAGRDKDIEYIESHNDEMLDVYRGMVNVLKNNLDSFEKEDKGCETIL